jgi:hypothetical protein
MRLEPKVPVDPEGCLEPDDRGVARNYRYPVHSSAIAVAWWSMRDGMSNVFWKLNRRPKGCMDQAEGLVITSSCATTSPFDTVQNVDRKVQTGGELIRRPVWESNCRSRGVWARPKAA